MPPENPIPNPGAAAKNKVVVKRYDINLKLQDILTPLTRIGAAAPGKPDLDPHLAQVRQVAGSLKDLADHIDSLDPTVFGPPRI